MTLGPLALPPCWEFQSAGFLDLRAMKYPTSLSQLLHADIGRSLLEAMSPTFVIFDRDLQLSEVLIALH